MEGAQVSIIDYSIGFKLAELLCIYAHRLQDFCSVLPQDGSGTRHVCRRGGIFDGETDGVDATGNRMLDFEIHFACTNLWVLVHLVECVHRTGWNLCRLKPAHPCFGCACLQGLCQYLREYRKVFHTLCIGGEEGILQEVGMVQCLCETLPVALIRCSDGNPTIGCLQDLIGSR